MCGLMAALVASLLSLSPGGLEILTIDTGDVWANSTISAIPGHNVTTITAAGIGGIDFALFDVLYVTDAYFNTSTPTWASELIARGPDIETYINGGGFVIVGVEAFGSDSITNGDEYNFLPSGLVDGQTVGPQVFGNDVVITDPTHPLFNGITSADLSNWGSSYHGSLPVGTLPVLATNAGGLVLIRGGSVGAGGVFVWSLDPDFHHPTPGTLSLVENAIGLVQAGPGDSDGDGVPDDEDACPESILTATIIIDGCDTGVENVLFEDGCTMADLIAQCADSASNHGAFVSCVAHLTNEWKKSGLISGQEKGQIQSCAAQADIPGDLDGDGIVNVTDLLQILAAWGLNPGHAADFNADGVVNVTDLLTLLANWG